MSSGIVVCSLNVVLVTVLWTSSLSVITSSCNIHHISFRSKADIICLLFPPLDSQHALCILPRSVDERSWLNHCPNVSGNIPLYRSYSAVHPLYQKLCFNGFGIIGDAKLALYLSFGWTSLQVSKSWFNRYIWLFLTSPLNIFLVLKIVTVVFVHHGASKFTLFNSSFEERI